MSISEINHSADASEGDMEEAIRRIGEEIGSLHALVRGEQHGWLDHVAASRLVGPRGLDQGTQVRTLDEILQQLQALFLQIHAYNTRIRASQQRGAVRPELLLADLIPWEDGRPTLTEMASSLIRRIIIATRLELMLHAASLQKLEDQVSSAFEALGKLADHVLQDFEMYKDAPGACLRSMRDECNTEILMLKAAMARLGMEMPRQRLLDEFFSRVESEGVGSGDANDGDGVLPDETPTVDNEHAMRGDSRGDVEIGSDDEVDARPVEVTEMEEAEYENDGCGSRCRAKQGQTRIRDYFSPYEGP